MKNSKIAQMGLMIALAFVLGYLETLIPLHIGIPGVKLGLANIVVIIALVRFGEKEALFLAIIRAVLSGFTFGSLYSMAYSLSGGIISTLFMSFMHKVKKFSIIGISVAGGVTHNMGQLLVAMIVLRTVDLRYYSGVLILSGVMTGILVGVVSTSTLRHLR